MPFIEWTEEFLTGFPEIDTQHKRLVILTNHLYECIRSGEAPQVVDEILDDLFAYAHYHFKTEERLMEKYDYPELPSHRREHQKFIAKIREFLDERQHSEEKTKLTIEIMKFLKDWLISHVLGTDKKYVPYLQAKISR
ncbi:MAG: hemerythrin family protein [Thermodesulfobacteria bacterium]|nr:hemerythrin family protein [Thermodesulfobacteriota bacterium]